MEPVTKTSITVRMYTKADYPVLSDWWTKYSDWDAVHPSLLPNDGFIVEANGSPICAAFLYMAGNSLCSWLEWVVADPNVEAQVRADGLDALLAFACDYATKNGFPFQFICVKHPKLMERLEQHGFMKGDKDMQMMIRRSK